MAPSLVVATRLHLGHSSTPPSQDSLDTKIASYYEFCLKSCQSPLGLIAVDSTPKIEGYDLVQAVQTACDKVQQQQQQQPDNDTCKNNDEDSNTTKLHVLPVTPWGKFVPALNALIGYACTFETTKTTTTTTTSKTTGFDQILFVSAETSASPKAIQHLRAQISTDDDTLVAGAVLAGHDYRGGTCSGVVVPLTGRTSPWNTLAVWNLRKLALTGFSVVSDGLLTDPQQAPSFGIEEVAATALLQKLLGPEQAKSKLVQLPDIEWQVDNFQDPERTKWQEQKMKSKEERATRQLELLGLQGSVHHC